MVFIQKTIIMKLRSLILITLLFCCQQAFAQNLNAGHYIDKNGKKVAALIDFRDWEINPTEVRYRKRGGATTEILKPGDIQSFGIKGIDLYFSKTVAVNVAPIEVNEMTESPDPIFEKRTVFLKLVIDGKAKLYVLNDEKRKRHFFIEKEGLPATELIYTRFFTSEDDERKMARKEEYRNQLKKYLSDCPAVQKQIDEGGYTDYDFEKLFTAYNECMGGEEPPKGSTAFGLTGGVGGSFLKFSGTSSLNLDDMNFTLQPDFAIGLYGNFATPLNQFALRTEILYRTLSAKSHHEARTSDEYYTISDVAFRLGYIQANLLPRVYFPSRGKTTFYLEGGAGYAYLLSDYNAVEFERKFYGPITYDSRKVFEEVKKAEYSGIAGFGFTNKGLNAAFRFEYGKQISPYIYSTSYTKAVFLMFSYDLFNTKSK